MYATNVQCRKYLRVATRPCIYRPFSVLVRSEIFTGFYQGYPMQKRSVRSFIGTEKLVRPTSFAHVRHRPWLALDLPQAFRIISFQVMQDMRLIVSVGHLSFKIDWVLHRLNLPKMSVTRALRLYRQTNTFVSISTIFIWKRSHIGKFALQKFCLIILKHCVDPLPRWVAQVNYIKRHPLGSPYLWNHHLGNLSIPLLAHKGQLKFYTQREIYKFTLKQCHPAYLY